MNAPTRGSARVGWLATVAAAALTVALALGGCGGARDGPAKAEAPPKATIVVDDDAYVPDHVRIPVGGRVTFVGRGRAPNTVETDDVGSDMALDREDLDRREQFDLHTIAPGEAHTVEFDTPGFYSFHSSFNGTLFGSVEVVGERR